MRAGARTATEMPEGFVDIRDGERLGEWRIVQRIGKGRYGRVYEAAYEPRRWRRKRDMPARAALKVFQGPFLWSREAQVALSDEAAAMRSINHPNVLRFYADITLPRGSKYPGTRFFVLELGECDLHEEVDGSRGGLAPEQVKEIARDILLGLREVHNRLVHHDIKPENVIGLDPVRRTA